MTTLKINPKPPRRHSGRDPESVGSDSLMMGKAQTKASPYPYNFYIYGITYFWLDPKVPKTQCLPARGRR
jgi:hypothetical protein